MMPKFLKDLFPDMDKPDNPLGAIGDAFGKMFGGDEEEAPAAEEPAPADEAPEEAPPAEE